MGSIIDLNSNTRDSEKVKVPNEAKAMKEFNGLKN